MGANFCYFKTYKKSEECESGHVEAVDLSWTNHSYGGISGLVDFLKTENINFYDYMDYTEGGHDCFTESKLLKQRELLATLEQKLPEWKNRFREQIKISDQQKWSSGADDSPTLYAYFVSWIETWIENIKEGMYIGYQL